MKAWIAALCAIVLISTGYAQEEDKRGEFEWSLSMGMGYFFTSGVNTNASNGEDIDRFNTEFGLELGYTIDRFTVVLALEGGNQDSVNEIETISGINDNTTHDSDWAVDQFFVQYTGPDGTIVGFGRIDLTDYFDTNEGADGFFNSAFVNNIAVEFTDPSITLHAWKPISESVTVGFGVSSVGNNVGETHVEFFYNLVINDHANVTFDVQYLDNLAGNKDNGSAWVFGIYTSFEF